MQRPNKEQPKLLVKWDHEQYEFSGKETNYTAYVKCYQQKISVALQIISKQTISTIIFVVKLRQWMQL